ncbi:hypothetical protein C2G38_2228935, partial [Gigaspora rosea]
MPRQKGAFWNEYELDEDDLEAEKYRCKHCNTKYVKNASRLQTHLEKCVSYQNKLAVETTESTNTTSNNNNNEVVIRLQKKRRPIQVSIDGFTYKYSESDQKALENLLTRAFCLAGISFNVIENEDVKAVFQK